MLNEVGVIWVIELLIVSDCLMSIGRVDRMFVVFVVIVMVLIDVVLLGFGVLE